MSVFKPRDLLDKWQKYAVKVIHVSVDARVSSFVLESDEWRELQSGENYSIEPFGQAVWLVSAKNTLFRRCTFPADILSKADIAEAVHLELSQWSPWKGKSGVYFIPTLIDDKWDVSVWVWDAEKENELCAALQSSGMVSTHILPQDVWMSAGMGLQASSALVIYQIDKRYRYLYVSAGQIISLGWVESKRDARFCWQSLGLLSDAVEVIAVDENIDISELPWLPDREVITGAVRWLPASLIERGRLLGGRDWRDPMAWKSLFIALGLLMLVWMIGGSLLVWNKQSSLQTEYQQAYQDGENVLQVRNTVDALGVKLLAVKRLKQQQSVPIVFIEQLSTYLPDDVWLYSMRLRRDTVEIKGQGKYAATLAGVLNKMPMVDRVSYVGDIRRIPQSEQESFGILLHLKESVEP